MDVPRVSGDHITSGRTENEPKSGRTENEPARRSWSFVKDGPPFVIVAPTFVFLVAGLLASSSPARGMAVLAVGLMLTLALEFAAWARQRPEDRRVAEASFETLSQRLKDARTRQLDRSRWR